MNILFYTKANVNELLKVKEIQQNNEHEVTVGITFLEVLSVLEW